MIARCENSGRRSEAESTRHKMLHPFENYGVPRFDCCSDDNRLRNGMKRLPASPRSQSVGIETPPPPRRPSSRLPSRRKTVELLLEAGSRSPREREREREIEREATNDRRRDIQLIEEPLLDRSFSTVPSSYFIEDGRIPCLSNRWHSCGSTSIEQRGSLLH